MLEKIFLFTKNIFKIFFTVTLIFSVLFVTSGCQVKPKPTKPIIKANRKFAKYLEPPSNTYETNYVDLSDGKKQKYDMYLGPQRLNFDIKINTKY